MFYPQVGVVLPLVVIGINATLFEGFTPPAISQVVNTCGVGKSPVIALWIAVFGMAQLI